MRPPLRATEPASAGVSMRMRGDRASAASRVSIVWPDPANVPGIGEDGWPSFGLGVGTPSGPLNASPVGARPWAAAFS